MERINSAGAYSVSSLDEVGFEVRTCVNSMLAVAELLLDSELSKEQREVVSFLRASADRLLLKTGQATELSYHAGPEAELDCLDFDLPELLGQTVDLMKVLATDNSASIDLQIDADLPKIVRGDRRRLEQILLNVVRAAMRNHEEAPIRVVAGQSGTPDYIRFRISTPAGGTLNDVEDRDLGVDLAVARKLVDAMHGDVVLNRTAESCNVQLTIPLPVVGAGNTHADAQLRRPSRKAIRILLAEDTLESQYLIKAYVKGEDYSVDIVSDGADAVEKFTTNVYSLVLMDIDMPTVNGIDATRRIRSWERTKHRAPVPIIALTAHHRNDQIKKCYEVGMTSYLSKPVARGTLLATIEEYGSRIN